MPFAVTHILAAIILIELLREYLVKNNKKMPRYYILIAAFGAIIPDLDVALYYILYFFGYSLDQIHRTFLHTLFVPIILVIISIFFWYSGIKSIKFEKKHLKISTTFSILAAASLLHLVLDALFGNIMPFYPLSNISVNLDLLRFFPEGLRNLVFPTIDAILMLSWIFWMEFKLKITRYF